MGRVGAVGFCYGGGVVNALAVAYLDLAAGVPFYGRQPEVADVPAIQAALIEHGKAFSVHFYPYANHGLHNDTTPRYDAEAAELAWERTLAFFGEHLKAELRLRLSPARASSSGRLAIYLDS